METNLSYILLQLYVMVDNRSHDKTNDILILSAMIDRIPHYDNVVWLILTMWYGF